MNTCPYFSEKCFDNNIVVLINRRNYFDEFEQLSQLYAKNHEIIEEKILISYKDIKSGSSCSFNNFQKYPIASGTVLTKIFWKNLKILKLIRRVMKTSFSEVPNSVDYKLSYLSHQWNQI